ncbi:hypothetical protein [Moraxella bovoculi]|nr:hypothetical protein [Moraxella bovoculi]
MPYTSSHLENANSQTIITGRHNIHENPKTIPLAAQNSTRRDRYTQT